MRTRRLLADAEQMRRAFDGGTLIRLRATEGEPPELYRIEYHIRGLARGPDGQPVPQDTHLVEIQLTSEYPRVSPRCRVLTPIFHPNIDPSTICVGDHWAAGERLVDLVVRIGEMIAYQAYNIKSPLDGEAAMWADLNPQRLPLDGRDLRPSEGEAPVPPAVGDAPPRPATTALAVATPRAAPAESTAPPRLGETHAQASADRPRNGAPAPAARARTRGAWGVVVLMTGLIACTIWAVVAMLAERSDRQAAEKERRTAEVALMAEVKGRKDAEAAQKAAEKARQEAEAARTAAEEARRRALQDLNAARAAERQALQVVNAARAAVVDLNAALNAARVAERQALAAKEKAERSEADTRAVLDSFRGTTETPKPSPSKYLMLPIDKVASAVSTKSLFTGSEYERLIFPTWGKQEVFGIPFHVTDPKGKSVKNAIVLYGPMDGPARAMPKAVALKCGSPAKEIHLLSGVAGAGYIRGDNRKKTVCMIVRFHYRGAGTEDHELINGVHFCDFMADAPRYYEAPGSRLAMRLLDPVPNGLTQIRYLAIQPKDPAKIIEEIEFLKPMNDHTAPVIMAVTVERPVQGEKTGEQVGEVRTFLGHRGSVRAVAYSPCGRYALSAGGHPNGDGTLRLWDLGNGKEVWSKQADSRQCTTVVFSPDGRRAVSGGVDGNLKLWEVETGKELRAWPHGNCVNGLAFLPDGKHLLSGGDSGWLRLWDLDTGKHVKAIQDTGRIWSIAVSPDGSRAITGSHTDKLRRLWDLKTGMELRRFEAPEAYIHPVAFSPSGRNILTSGSDAVIRLWDAETGEDIRQFIGHSSTVVSVAFSPDGQRALSGSGDGTIRLWDVATGKELHRFEKFLPSPSWIFAAFSPDGHSAFSGAGDGIGRLWRLPDPPAAKDKP
jgi:WD40 repeat protein/ubiquitin-protein ligase